MERIDLKGTENAREIREKLNTKFNEIIDYLNKDFANSGLISTINNDKWIYSDEYHCYIYNIKFDFSINGRYINFSVYDNTDEVVHCDIVRDIYNRNLIICSDIKFEGWVSCR